MPILSFESDNEWLIATLPKVPGAIKSHFSFDSSTYEIDTNDTQPERPFTQEHRTVQSWRSQEGLGHCATNPIRASDIPVVHTRPPLRPTVSPGNISTYSYYSQAADGLDKKSQALAIEEEAYQAASNLRVYSCITMLCCLNFLYGKNITTLAPALPTLAYDLNILAVRSFWLVNVFLLAATLIQPLAMRLSAAVGSKIVLSSSLLLWKIGAIVSALTARVSIILVGRAITGVGAGAAGVLVPLVLRQILKHKRPISERSVSLSFWIGTFAGPVIGGALARPSCWRYFFYLDLSVCLLALIGFPLLLQLPAVDASLWKSTLHLDYIGWLLLSGSITSLALAVTWAGVEYAWVSLQVLASLTTAAVCFACWVIRSIYAEDPILPVGIFRKRAGMAACLGILIHGMVFIGLVHFAALFYYVGGNILPFTSALMLSPYTLALAMGSLTGSITLASFHRWSVWCSWAIVSTGTGLLLIARETTIRTVTIPIGMVIGIALGVLVGGLNTTLQSTPTNDQEMINAAPLSVFFNSLGSTMGLSICSCVFLNRLGHTMQSIPALQGNAKMFTRDAVKMAYVTSHLTAEQAGLKAALVAAYMDALRSVWILLAVLAGFAFLFSTYNLLPSRNRRHNDQENQDSYSL